MSKRVAIVGTAATWRQAPWGERDVQIWSLNDAYVMGLPRFDGWWELHPLGSFIYRKAETAHDPAMRDIPPGTYLRPHGYLEWLQAQAQTMPVWLQTDPPSGWPRALRYPLESIVSDYRAILQIDPTWPVPYVASGPAWMLLYAFREHYSEASIWGIHLSTDREYVDQRPNFELIIGYVIGRDMKIVLPPQTPICKSRNLYCYSPRMAQAQDPLKRQLRDLETRHAALVAKIIDRRMGWFEGKALRRQIRTLTVEMMDLQQTLGHLQLAETLSGPEWRSAAPSAQADRPPRLHAV